MSIISPADLEASPLADLHALASALGIDGFRRLRKEDLVDAILARQGAAAPPRGRRRAAAPAAVSEESAEQPSAADDGEQDEERPARPARSRRRRGRGRDVEAAAGGETATGGEEAAGAAAASEEASDQLAEGVVELLANGSGFLRINADEPSDGDVYISAAQARRCELVSGDRISGPVRVARRSERHPSLIRIDTINGVPAEQAVVGTRIDDLDADFATVALALGEDPVLVAVAAAAPFGRGSRVVISGPPRSGRSELLRRLGAAIAASEGLEVEILAVGVRPEELSEYRELPHATSTGLSFAASGEAQEAIVEQAAERGRRIAVRGGDAVLLIDSLDGLSPAAQRRVLAAARNLRGAGSLTIVAAARAAVGGETTVIALRPDGEFPSLDPVATGTLRAELLAEPPAAKPARVRKPRAPRRSAIAAAPPSEDGEAGDGVSAPDTASPEAEVVSVEQAPPTDED